MTKWAIPAKFSISMSLIRVSDMDHVTFHVSNLKESIKFYYEVFGFEVKEGNFHDRKMPWAIIGLKGVAYLCLYQNEVVENENNTIMHWGFHIDIEDVDALSSDLQARGITVRDFPGSKNKVVDYRESDSIYVEDPDGYSIELSTVHGGGLN